MSFQVNMSHRNMLYFSDLRADVTSDEFFKKLFIIFYCLAMSGFVGSVRHRKAVKINKST